MTDATDDPQHAAAMSDARTLLDAGLVSELITETHALAQNVGTLADRLVANTVRLEELTDLRHRNRTLIYVAVGLAAGLVLAIVASLLLGFFAFRRLTDIANDNNANGRVLVECTTASPTPPSTARDEADQVHECYERGAVAQAKAIELIGDDIVRAAVCARQFDDEAGIGRCVRDARARAIQEATP